VDLKAVPDPFPAGVRKKADIRNICIFREWESCGGTGDALVPPQDKVPNCWLRRRTVKLMERLPLVQVHGLLARATALCTPEQGSPAVGAMVAGFFFLHPLFRA
jgi:hypothetical protein